MTQVGRFEILEEIGRGGMARVHLARQLDLDRYVALKELGSLQREDAQMVERFLRESRLAGALNHPNIVTVLEFFEHNGIQYIAMEYVPRGSLRPWIGRLTLPQAGGVLEGVLAGLAHAHQSGVVHRDLKPENLMVTSEGRIKIADFGIAKALAEEGTTAFKTATGVAIGTPTYMSPEQALAQSVGPWTDLYATGVIAYELLSSRPPFDAGEPLAILFAHCGQEPPPLSERAPGVPAPIAEWVHGLLAKEPSGRPASARAAWEDLEEHLLEVLGPRWRREARIEGAPEAPRPATESRPVTPAQFPTGAPPPADSAEWGSAKSDTWDTFEQAEPPRPPVDTSAEALPSMGGPAPPAETPPPREAPPPDEPPPPAPAPEQESEPARSRRGLLLAGLAALAVLAIVLAVVLGGGGGEEGEPTAAAAPLTIAGFQSEAAPLGEDWTRAIHVWTYNRDGYTSDAYAQALQRAKADGATAIVLHPFIRVESETSSELREDEDQPPWDALADGFEAIEGAGLEAIVQPIVEPEGSYAGVYEPDDLDAFFAAYSERVRAWADVAGEHGAAGFVVGSYLSNIDGEGDAERWTGLIEDVRDRCSCLVGYEAEELDGAGDVQFWPAVDVIGVSSLEPLVEEPTNDPAALAAAWEERKASLREISEEHDKPLVIFDLGYTSREDQAAMPPTEAFGPPSEEAQAALYEAAFRAFRGEEWFRGIAWFEMNGDGRESEPTDYHFEGKAAERVLRAWQTAR
jgi:serine/threonine protein kinase